MAFAWGKMFFACRVERPAIGARGVTKIAPIKLQVIFPYYCISISHNVANPVLSLYSIKSKEYAGIKYLNLSTNINGGENSPPLAS